MLKALRVAQKLPQVKNEDFELRYLNFREIEYFAVWLHGKSSDIIIPLPPANLGWRPYRPYSEREMMKLLRSRADLKWGVFRRISDSNPANGQPLFIPRPTPDPPPLPAPDLPGQNAGKIETYWLAPFVRASKGFGETTVTWFADDGRVRRQTAVSVIEPGFVGLPSSMGHGHTILGVNEDWKITLPPEPANVQSRYSMSGYLTSTPDSRVFVHEYHPKSGLVALDIYIHGKLANTVGPFLQHQGEDVTLNDDGSAGLPIWSDEFKTNAQIVSLDTNGIIRPGAAHPAAESGMGPNAICVGRIPGTHESLIRTSFGLETNRYHLMDEDTGKQVWDIPCPGGGQPLSIGFTPNFVIFSVAELYGWNGPWRGSEWVFLNGKKNWIRTFYAVDIQDGRTIARWQEKYPRRYSDSDEGHFLWIKNRLFYIAATEFTQLDFEDILAKQNGWV